MSPPTNFLAYLYALALLCAASRHAQCSNEMASEVTVFDNACDMRSGAFLGPHWEVHQRILNHFNIFYTGNTSYIINENLFLMTKLPLVCFLVKSKGYGKVSNACASCTSSPYRVMFPSEIEQLYVQVLLGNKILRLTQN